MGISTNCPLFLYIIQNPLNEHRLRSIGIPLNRGESNPNSNRKAFYFYSFFMQNHVRPADSILQVLEERRSYHGNRNSICMHIRCGIPLADFGDQASFLSIKDISTFYRCQSHFQTKDRSSHGNVVIVASDSSRAKNIIRNFNAGRSEVVWWENKTSHTMTRSFRKTRSSVINSAVIDLFSLAQCSHFVGTFRSSFSITAAALMGNVPFLVKQGGKRCEIPKVITFG